MPRRRTPKGKGAQHKSNRLNKADGAIKKWNTASDVPLDEVDQFHAGRDRILLEGEEDLYDEGEEEEEVFGLKGLNDDDEEQGLDGLEDDDDDEEPPIPAPSKIKKTERKTKGKKKAKGELSSDEEEEQNEEEESWGRGKAAYYNSNADELDSDDEEGHELEEQEARRLQAKAREDMRDEDFGLMDIIDVQKDDIDLALEEPQVVTKPVLPTDPKELLRHLVKTSPEAVALARDWEDVSEKLVQAHESIKKVESTSPDALSLGMVHLHYQTLLSYSTILAFYLHLRASDKYVEKPALLQSHPIMNRLLSLKKALVQLEDLDFASSSNDENSDDDYSDDDIHSTGMKWDDILADGQNVWGDKSLFDEELAQLLADADQEEEPVSPKPKKKKKPTEKKEQPSPKKKRKIDVAPVFDLEEPEWVPSSKPTSSRKQQTEDSFGEASQLHQADADDKTARKKSLRFHTSKIESASARRNSARNQASGGDDDIPYRERKKQKELRLEQEARIRLAKQGGADLDDEMPEKRKRKDSDDGEDGDESPDEYYELVKKKSSEKKQKKKEEYEAALAAEKPDFTEEEASGPRSLTRAILKNRGLTPHRSKAVRNPRVKKRQKFEKAKKKVSSQKAIYNGGVSESGGKYGGEKSGISKVVKSVRLG